MWCFKESSYSFEKQEIYRKIEMYLTWDLVAVTQSVCVLGGSMNTRSYDYDA